MPIYEYICPESQEQVEVLHGINEEVKTWQELCALTGLALGETRPDAPVHKLISVPGLAFPKTNSELKNMGFTKLVRREKGVYENVTATGEDARYMKADDPNSVPNFKKTIRD